MDRDALRKVKQYTSFIPTGLMDAVLFMHPKDMGLEKRIVRSLQAKFGVEYIAPFYSVRAEPGVCLFLFDGNLMNVEIKEGL